MATQPTEDRHFWDEEWRKATVRGPGHPDAPTWQNEVDERLLDFLRPYLPASGLVAELGCGSGRLLARIGRTRPVSLVAVDYAVDAMPLVEQSARTFGVPIQRVLSDVTRLGIADASFDLILSGGLLEHLDDPRPALAEMLRTLKPGGAVFATVVPRRWFFFHRPLHRWLGPQVHRTGYEQGQYAAWLRELGAVDVVTEGKGFYPPLFHHLPTRSRRFIERCFRPFDGTWLAAKLGYFFVFAARRPA
jgi:SAM-dependent methyltransferase